MNIEQSTYSEFIPTNFMVVYTRKENTNEKYLEIGNITESEDKYSIAGLQPANMEFLNDLVSAIKTENYKALKWEGVIPKNVLYYHSENSEPTIMWLRPAEKRQLHFNEKKQSGNYELHDILFVAYKGELYVFRYGAHKTNPLQSKLYYVPLPNIYDDCRVCTGNAEKTRPKTTEQYIKHMEDLFYMTNFNDLHHTNFGKGTVYITVLKTKNLNNFPKVPTKIKTVEQLLKELK